MNKLFILTYLLILSLTTNCLNKDKYKNPLDLTDPVGLFTGLILAPRINSGTDIGTKVTGGIFAGSTISGTIDGSGTNARFSSIQNICVDSTGTKVAVFQSGLTTSYRLITNGSVATVVITGITISPSSQYGSCAFDPSGNIYLPSNSCIIKITTGNVAANFAGCGGTGDGSGTGIGAFFSSIKGLTYSSGLSVFLVADQGNKKFKTVTTGAVVSTIAGTGATGNSNGALLSSTFNNFSAYAADPTRLISYLLDQNSLQLRILTITASSLLLQSDLFTNTSSSSSLSTTCKNVGYYPKIYARNGLVYVNSGDSNSFYNNNTNTYTYVHQFCSVTSSGVSTPYYFELGSNENNWLINTNQSIDSSGQVYLNSSNAIYKFSLP